MDGPEFPFGRMAIQAVLDEDGFYFRIGLEADGNPIRAIDLIDLKAAIDEALKWTDALEGNHLC